MNGLVDKRSEKRCRSAFAAAVQIRRRYNVRVGNIRAGFDGSWFMAEGGRKLGLFLK
jgi:hypothetical protein